MTQIKLKATSTNPKHPAGTVYEAAPIYAASDVYLHRAIYADADEPLTGPDQPSEDATATPRRTYKRRDLKAEP